MRRHKASCCSYGGMVATNKIVNGFWDNKIFLSCSINSSFNCGCYHVCFHLFKGYNVKWQYLGLLWDNYEWSTKKLTTDVSRGNMHCTQMSRSVLTMVQKVCWAHVVCLSGERCVHYICHHVTIGLVCAQDVNDVYWHHLTPTLLFWPVYLSHRVQQCLYIFVGLFRSESLPSCTVLQCVPVQWHIS